MAHFDGGGEAFESRRLVRVGFGENEMPKGAVVLVEAAGVQQAIDNVCLYALVRVAFFIDRDGLAPLGLVGRLCDCGDGEAAEEQGYGCDLVLSSNGRNASEASFAKARDGWWTVCCSIRALRQKCVDFFMALGSLVVGLQQRLDLPFSRQIVHKGDAVIPANQDVMGYRVRPGPRP